MVILPFVSILMCLLHLTLSLENLLDFQVTKLRLDFGIDRVVLQWVRFYLSGWFIAYSIASVILAKMSNIRLSQTVDVGADSVSPVACHLGVLQGWVHGPILFLVYILLIN